MDSLDGYQEAAKTLEKLRDIKKFTGFNYRRRDESDIYEISFDDFKTISTTVKMRYPFLMVQYALKLEFGYTDFLLDLWEGTCHADIL